MATTTESSSAPVTLTSDVTTANTKGAWSTLIASTTSVTRGLLVYFGDGTDRKDFLVDIGVGSGTPTVIIADILHATAGGAWGAVFFSRQQIGAGETISARCQCTTANSTLRAYAVSIQGDWNGGNVWTSLDTIGASTADSGGVGFTPGNASKGGWTSVIGSTAQDYDGLVVAIGGQNNSALLSRFYAIDIGVGSGTPTVIIPDITFGTTIGEIVRTPTDRFYPVAIPAGSELSVRGESSGTADALDVVLYGVTYATASTGALLQPVIPNG